MVKPGHQQLGDGSTQIIVSRYEARGSHLPLPHVGSLLPLLRVDIGAELTLG